jgi:hypothetical protein
MPLLYSHQRRAVLVQLLLASTSTGYWQPQGPQAPRKIGERLRKSEITNFEAGNKILILTKSDALLTTSDLNCTKANMIADLQGGLPMLLAARRSCSVSTSMI